MIVKKLGYKEEYLTQALETIQTRETNGEDAYNFYNKKTFTINTKELGSLGKIVNQAMNECLKLEGYSSDENVWIECWVNRVQPTMVQTTNRHNHTQIALEKGHPIPLYTWIYYIQMPNNLTGDQAKLVVEEQGKINKYLPNVGELIILDGDVWHEIEEAPNSTLDRIVIAGNMGIMKKTKSLI